MSCWRGKGRGKEDVGERKGVSGGEVPAVAGSQALAMVDNKELRGHIPRGLANAKTFGQICKDAGLGKAKENADKLDAEVGVANTEDGKVYVISNGHLVEALSQVPREDATQVVGEFIYAYIEQWAAQCGSKSVAPNLTGMLLEMDLGDLLHMTEDLNALNAKLYEAFIVLQKAGKVPPSASTSAVVHQKASARKERQRSARTWAKVDLRAEVRSVPCLPSHFVPLRPRADSLSLPHVGLRLRRSSTSAATGRPCPRRTWKGPTTMPPGAKEALGVATRRVTTRVTTRAAMSAGAGRWLATPWRVSRRIWSSSRKRRRRSQRRRRRTWRRIGS